MVLISTIEEAVITPVALRCLNISRLASWCIALGPLVIAAATLPAQMPSAKAASYPGGVKTSIGITTTSLSSYNLLPNGGSISVFAQPKSFLGTQVSVGSYPRGAQVRQSPVTVGYRIGSPNRTNDSYGWRYISPVFYVGGGLSRSHDWNSLSQPTRGAWYPCLESRLSVSIPYRHATWRLVEFSYADTFTPVRELHSFSGTSGLTYRF